MHKKTSSNIYSHLHLTAIRLWSNKKLRLLSLNSIYAVGESIYQFRAAFVNKLWPLLWAVGFSKVFSSLGAAISYWFSGKLIKKFGAYRLLLLSNIYSKCINIFSVLFASVFSPLLHKYYIY